MTSKSKYRIVGCGASTLFRPILESSRPPSAYIGSLLDGEGVGSRVGSWRGCLTRSFLGGDVFLRGAMRWMG
jgi:hypothetical protein